jgi:hypothetical protein
VWKLLLFVLAVFESACSRLETLTPVQLDQAEQNWRTHQPVTYRLVIEMSGDRVETGTFEALVRDGKVVTLRRNGLGVTAGSGEDYSMDGLFRMMRQELSLAEKPTMLGAPAGYSAYLQAEFDTETGRLIRYRRSVGGASNAIEIEVLEYAPL